MTTQEAIKQLQTEHDLIAGEHDLDGSQFAPALLEALAMAIEVMQGKGDLISRQALLKQIDIDSDGEPGYYGDTWKFIDTIKNMPSAQPEIIRCRECKFASGDSRICMKFDHSPIGELDFCAWAERRTDG